jgi:hypothetical protein
MLPEQDSFVDCAYLFGHQDWPSFAFEGQEWSSSYPFVGLEILVQVDQHMEMQGVWVEMRQNLNFPQKEQQRRKLQMDPAGWRLVSFESFEEADQAQQT